MRTFTIEETKRGQEKIRELKAKGEFVLLPKADIAKAIRDFCYECCGQPGTYIAIPHHPRQRKVDFCDCKLTPILTYAFGEIVEISEDQSRGCPPKRRLLATIKTECQECLGEKIDLDLCSSPNCKLYPYRHGQQTIRNLRVAHKEK